MTTRYHMIYTMPTKSFVNARENLVGKYGFLSAPKNEIFVRKRRFVKGVIRVRVRVRLIFFFIFLIRERVVLDRGKIGPWLSPKKCV